ncbi:hypothetical protein HNV11_13440 [Spirosoma taeanense]|uniref:Uncharacterized protein n=1 Tax=Spirosoma taeanense TaxID=2735870 RepID=A0A6M5Y7G6_9BACT|nr:hypothetical protein [Spirosoma taeanense]QJW90307.1 hypothetical protein HNV11_13440 [Spirosoma taeanense]
MDAKLTDAIEPRIRPLVDALNATGLVQTFSSCEGHYAPHDQTLVDRNRAEVRFVPIPGVSMERVEQLLAGLLTSFKVRHGLIPINLIGYKLYTPIDDVTIEETFVLELRPFNRFDPPERKRADTDRAVEQVVQSLTGLIIPPGQTRLIE